MTTALAGTTCVRPGGRRHAGTTSRAPCWRPSSGRPQGSPVANAAFAVGSVGFNALVAFNAMELATVTDDERLRADSIALADALAEPVGPRAGHLGRRRTHRRRFGPPAHDRCSSAAASRGPSAPRAGAAGARALTSPAAHGAPFGPTGVHRSEPAFAPSTYWRGSSWPQLTYLLALATSRSGDSEETASLASSLRAGALSSGWAEHWDPDSGVGLGAAPQSWTTLAAVEIGAQRAAT